MSKTTKITDFKPMQEELLSLRKQNELLISAAKLVLKSWDENMRGEKEEFKESYLGGYLGGYWSPHQSMVKSEAINNLRKLLSNI